jgi:hypothetical protein
MSDAPSRLLDRVLPVDPDRRKVVVAWIAAVAALTALSAWLRAPGWNPPSLFSDDEWVGIVATRMTASGYLSLRPPVPAGFALVLAALTRVFADPEWSLQLLPVASSLALVPLAAWTLHRLTGRLALGLLGAALVAVDPRLAAFGVRAKPYALDAVLSLGLVLVATWALERPGTRRACGLAAAAAGAAVFSFPALFVGAALVGALALQELQGGPERRRSALLAIAVFAVGAAAIYTFLLAGAIHPVLSHYWRVYFLPTRGPGEAARFLATRGWSLLAGPFPGPLGWLVALVPLGLVVLYRRRSTRWFAVGALLLGAQVLVASALGRYPLGNARTDLYTHGLLIVLVCAALLPLFTPRASRTASVVVAATSALLVLALAKPSRYPPRQDARLVRQAEAALGPRDALVLSLQAGIAAGYYWPGEVALRPEDRGCGFNAEVRRPLAVTLSRRRSARSAGMLADLRPVLGAAPPRVVYLATGISGPSHQLIRRAILAAGYEVESQRRGPVAALVVFRKVAPESAAETAP